MEKPLNSNPKKDSSSKQGALFNLPLLIEFSHLFFSHEKNVVFWRVNSEKHCVKKSPCHSQWSPYDKMNSAQKAPRHGWVLLKTLLSHVGTIRWRYISSQRQKSCSELKSSLKNSLKSSCLGQAYLGLDEILWWIYVYHTLKWTSGYQDWPFWVKWVLKGGLQELQRQKHDLFFA